MTAAAERRLVMDGGAGLHMPLRNFNVLLSLCWFERSRQCSREG